MTQTIPKALVVVLLCGIWLLLIGGGSGSRGMAIFGLWLVFGSLAGGVLYRNWRFS